MTTQIKAFLSLLTLGLLSVQALAQTPVMGSYYKGPVSRLPGNCTEAELAVVTDGDSTSDCSTGGGSSANICVCNSAASWVDVGGGGAGGGFGTTICDVTLSGTQTDCTGLTGGAEYWELLIIGATQDTDDGGDVRLRVDTGAGFETGADYDNHSRQRDSSGTSETAANSNISTSIALNVTPNAGDGIDEAATASFDGAYIIYNPSSTTANKKVVHKYPAAWDGSNADAGFGEAGGRFDGNTNAIVGLRVFLEAGSFTGGRMLVVAYDYD